MTALMKPEYIQGNDFIAEVIRTQRTKSATIKVVDGIVSIVVPRGLSGERIDQLLKDKKKWIKEKVTHYNASVPVSTKQYVSGEVFSYLGRNYRLKVVRGAFSPVKLVHGYLVATLPNGADQPLMVRNAIAGWYRYRAEEKLREKVARYSKIVGVEPRSVGIKTFKSRWGSCSSKGDVDINWKIIAAPTRVVDYVVVHELSHLMQHDHSPKFWKLVERVIPNYMNCKEWLKVNGGELGV